MQPAAHTLVMHLGDTAMRMITDILFGLALRAFWRRHFADQYAVLLADIGLTRQEQEVMLELRRTR
jgi:monomeric isocitrate dehydrogenase